MKRYIFFLLSICTLLCIASSAFGQQTLFGTMTDDTGDLIVGGTIKVLKENTLITGGATDLNGNYSISLAPDTYNIEFSYMSFTPQRIEGVKILANQRNKLDMILGEEQHISSCTVRTYTTSPLNVSETTQGMIINSDEIRRVSKPN